MVLTESLLHLEGRRLFRARSSFPAEKPHGCGEHRLHQHHSQAQVEDPVRAGERGEDVPCEEWDARAAQAAADKENWTEATRDVNLLCHPRITRTKLPRNGETN
jgi:hypothetical protein